MNMTECDKIARELKEECARLDAEVQMYHRAADLYGVDPVTMLNLAKSQIKVCADNVSLNEAMKSVLDVFKLIPENLTANEVRGAIACYDGDGSKPYCDLVYCGLDIIRRYLEVRGELNKWKNVDSSISKEEDSKK